jgi:fructose-1,6-bisphosphatase II
VSVALGVPAAAFEAAVAPALLDATEAAACAALGWVGRGEKESLDGAAVDAMRASLGQAFFEGVVVVGEGEKDEAPMLYVGERLGRQGPLADVAVDPIDGTGLASRGGAGAIAVIGAAPRGTLLQTRLSYMEKIVAGPAARGHVDPDRNPVENLLSIARAVGRSPSTLIVAMLDRPRNAHVLNAVREIGARVKLFADGDIVNGVLAALGDGRVDVLMGIGGAPEGVITACAVKALGGEMCGRFWLRDRRDCEIAAAESRSVERALLLDDLCAGSTSLFVASGLTDGDLLRGARPDGRTLRVQSLLISSRLGGARFIETLRRP